MHGNRIGRFLKPGALIALACITLFPLLWMELSSFKVSIIAVFYDPFALPNQISLENYETAIREGRMGDYFINSMWVTAISAAATVLLGAWAGFALSKRGFPFRKLWMVIFLIGIILPVQAYLIPLVDVLQWLRIHDSLWALILPYTAQNLPIAVMLFAAYFRELPVELEEVAQLEGMRTGRYYFTILLPVAKPAAATVVVISCLNTWNEFLMALLFIVDPAMKTLPVGMIAFEATHNTDYPSLLAGLSLITFPALIAYAVFHRHVHEGVVHATR